MIQLELLVRTQTITLEATKADLAIRKASEDRYVVECNAIAAEKGYYSLFFFSLSFPHLTAS